MNLSDMTPGLRVRLVRDIELFPIAIFPAGLTGAVVDADPDAPDVVAHVRLDKYFPDLDEWDNELQVHRDASAYPTTLDAFEPLQEDA